MIDVQQTVSEHDTRYTHLHNTRGEVIDETYKKIDKITRLLGASARLGRFNNESSPETQQADARKIFGELFEYYFQNRLYLDKDLCTQIEQFFDAVFNIAEITLGTASSSAIYLPFLDQYISSQHARFIEEARKLIIHDLPPIRDLIEKRMRIILGIDTDKAEPRKGLK